MKATELRQSILQAAVQGRLVPQDPNDEPASELLKRIQQEKARFVKEGKIKKEKPLPPITEDEIPYDLPDGWIWCRLQDIVSFFNGDRSKNYPNRTEYTSSGIPWVNTGHILPNGTLTEEGMNYISEEKYQSLSGGKIKPNDLVFCLRGATFGKVAKVTPYSYGAIASSLVIIRASQMIDIDYLLCLLKSPYAAEELRKYDNGSAQPNLAARDVAKYCIPLPPLREQHRITTRIDELKVLCNELEVEEKKLEDLEARFTDYLPKAILQSAVQGKLVPQDPHDEPASELLKRIRLEKVRLIKEGKLKKERPLPSITKDEIPYDLPEGWEWCRLGEICNYGSTQSVSSSEISPDSWILELEDIEKDTGNLLCKKTKAQRIPLSTKHYFRPNDILYSKLRPYLNKVLIAEDYGYCTSEIIPLSFYKGLIIQYILIYLRSPLFINYANECAYGVKMPRLGTNDGKLAMVPLPPLEEQQRIVIKVEELISLCSELKSIYTIPVKMDDRDNIIPFLPNRKEEETLLAARGNAGQLSNEAMQAIDDLFAEDEE